MENTDNTQDFDTEFQENILESNIDKLGDLYKRRFEKPSDNTQNDIDIALQDSFGNL